MAVIIPTYQRADRLPGIVAALEQQTLARSDFEVLISDDCSTDETAGLLDRLASRTPLTLRIMRTKRNSGPAVARNIAWRATDAPVLAFMDDDCVPAPGWLEAGAAYFEEPDVGIVQGRTLPDPSVPVWRGAGTQRIERFTNRYEACNIFYRREALSAVGGFDETIYFFGEDTVPGWAVRRLGAGYRFAPDALVHHEVVHRGIRWHIRWARLHRHWPMLVRRFPEMRRELLRARIFLFPGHAALLAAVVGTALGAFWRPGFALTAPFFARYTPLTLRPEEFVSKLADLGFDAIVVASLIDGSIRERTLML